LADLIAELPTAALSGCAAPVAGAQPPAASVPPGPARHFQIGGRGSSSQPIGRAANSSCRSLAAPVGRRAAISLQRRLVRRRRLLFSAAGGTGRPAPRRTGGTEGTERRRLFRICRWIFLRAEAPFRG